MNRSRRTLLQTSLWTVLPASASEQVAPFAPSQSVVALEQFALRRKQLIPSLSSAQLVDVMLDFYTSAKAVGLAPGSDSDMLLYQWGSYDWGKGRFFEFDITRQFIRRVDDTSVISQLSLKATYMPSASLAAIQPGNRWCESTGQVAEFRKFILASAAYRAVAFIRAKSVEASWSPV